MISFNVVSNDFTSTKVEIFQWTEKLGYRNSKRRKWSDGGQKKHINISKSSSSKL